MLLKHLAADHHVLQICLMESTEASKHHMMDRFQPWPILANENVIKLVLDLVPKPQHIYFLCILLQMWRIKHTMCPALNSKPKCF